ncbi:MAG: hypothetical protein K2V38_24115 [Gemmataceae bacterium]|nr:hypothetical protein [Gemmataceae bacterium]
MTAYLAFLACIGPPVVFAALPPRTEAWRRARAWFWRLLPVAGGLFYVNLTLIDPAGPGWLYYGAWLLFAVVAGVWCLTIGTIRAERDKWRQAHRAAADPPAADPPARKPWEK